MGLFQILKLIQPFRMKSSFIFKLFRPFQPFFSISTLRKITQQGLIIPFYHTVSNINLPHVRHLYHFKNIQQFEKDLDWLCTTHEPVTINDILKHINDGYSLPNNSFHLTFDDGLRQCIEEIAPILVERKLPATFFINSAFLDNRSLMFRYKISLLIDRMLDDKRLYSTIASNLGKEKQSEVFDLIRGLGYHQTEQIHQIAEWGNIDYKQFLEDEKPYMSHKHIHSLIDMGFQIGSHSVDHPHYFELSLQQQLDQTLTCHSYLKQQFDLKEDLFAFPFTDHQVTSSFFNEIYKDSTIQLSFGGAGLKNEMIKNHIQRIAAEDKLCRPLQEIVKTEYLYYILKALFRKNTIHRHHA